MLLIPALRRQRQADLSVRGQPGLHREFQVVRDTQRNTVLKNKQTNKHFTHLFPEPGCLTM